MEAFKATTKYKTNQGLLKNCYHYFNVLDIFLSFHPKTKLANIADFEFSFPKKHSGMFYSSRIRSDDTRYSLQAKKPHTG